MSISWLAITGASRSMSVGLVMVLSSLIGSWLPWCTRLRAVEILVFEVALGPLENALNSLGRFQMSTTRQGRTAVRRVGYRARLPTCSRLVDAQVGGAQRAVRCTRSVAPSRLLAASRPSVDHEHDRQLTLR